MAGLVPGGVGGVVGTRPPTKAPNQGISIKPPRNANEKAGQNAIAPPPNAFEVAGKNANVKPKAPTARQLQSMLRSKGYKLAVDGQWGPISRSAYKAFKSGVGAKRWNGNHPGSMTAPRNPGAGSGGGGGRGGGGGGGGGGRGGRGGGGGRVPGIQVIKPGQYAHASVNAQFGPLLASLASQRDLVQSQGRQNLADIGSYYNQLAQTITGQLQSGDQYAQQAMQQQSNDQQGLLAALGGGANPSGVEAGNFAALMHGALQGQLGAQHNYMTNQGTLAAQGRAQSLVDQQRLTAQQVQQINQQISQQNASKGAAYTKALGDAQQLKLQQLAELQNMQIAAGQFNLGQAQGMAQLRNMNLQNKQLKNQGSFGALTANDKAKLVEGVNSQMYNRASGEATSKPNQAWVAAANHLRALGYDVKTNPRVRAWLSHSWLNYVKDYNSTHKTKYTPANNGTPFTNAQWNS